MRRLPYAVVALLLLLALVAPSGAQQVVFSVAEQQILKALAHSGGVTPGGVIVSAAGWTDAGTVVRLLTATDQVQIGDGTQVPSGVPSLAFTSEPTTGLLKNDTNEIGFMVAGDVTAYVTANGLRIRHDAGYLGFGTDTLSPRLGRGATAAILELKSGANLRIVDLLARGVLTTDANSLLQAVQLTNGQLLIGSTGAAPVAAALQGVGVLVTLGPGSVTITGAPADATFITQTPAAGLSAEQALSLLGTGILKSTTGTGVVSIAVAGTDFAAPDATFITQTPSTGLSAEQALSALGTGVLKNTTGTGVLSIAAPGVDFPGKLYSQTSIQGGDTVSNTATQTNFASSYTLPGNSLAVGQVLRFHAAGVYGTTGQSTPQVDATTTSVCDACTSNTWSHTTAGSNRYIVVDVHIDRITVTSSGVQYAGVAMTLLGRATATNSVTEEWGLANPTVGANNVVVTLTGGAANGYAAARSYTGVAAATNTTTATGIASTASSVTVLAAATTSLIVDTMTAKVTTALTVGAGQTSQYNVNEGNGNTQSGGSRENGNGDTAMTWSWTGSSSWGAVATELTAVAASTGTLTLRAKYGSTVLAATGAYTPTASLTNQGWTLDATVTVLSTGAAGTVEAQGDARIASSTVAGAVLLMPQTAPVVIDTTASSALQVSVEWSIAATLNTIRMREFVIETL